MPIVSIQQHDKALLNHFKKMLTTGPTKREELLLELQKIDSMDLMVARLRELVSADHGQGKLWTKGAFGKGSRLRMRVEFVLQLIDEVYYKPLSLEAIRKEKVEKKNNDWLAAAHFYHKKLLDDIRETDRHSWLATTDIYGGLFRKPKEFAVEVHHHKNLTLAQPLKCYLHYLDEMIQKKDLNAEDIYHLITVFKFVSQHMQPDAWGDRQKPFFAKIIEFFVQFNPEALDLTPLERTNSDLFSEVLESEKLKLLAMKVKERVDLYLQYITEKPDDLNYKAITTRLKREEFPSDEFADLFYYELGMVLSIEQFRFGRSGDSTYMQENAALKEALDFIGEKIMISLPPLRDSNKMTSERFVETFGARLVPLALPDRLRDNFAFRDALHTTYEDAFPSPTKPVTVLTHVDKLKNFINTIYALIIEHLTPRYVPFLSSKKDEKETESEGEGERQSERDIEHDLVKKR